MPRLVEADEAQLASIYGESHSLWGAGLRLADYRHLWEELRGTRWALDHATFLVWIDEGRTVLSSMKLYRPRIRVGSRTSRCSVLGAIFTPRGLRRRGYAAAMIRVALDAARRRGEPLALLFSDIGARYYEELGFRPLPCEEQWGRIPRAADPSGPLLRPMSRDDEPAVHRAHEASARTRAVAMIRDPDHWDFLWTRTGSFFRRLQDPRVVSRAWVAEEHGRFAGYLLTVEGRGEWNVRELGSASGDPETMDRILRAGAARARSAGARRFYGWIPPEVTSRLADWRLHRQARRRAIPMVRPLEDGLDLEALGSLPACYFSYQDQF